jgi:hypothetical protein
MNQIGHSYQIHSLKKHIDAFLFTKSWKKTSAQIEVQVNAAQCEQSNSIMKTVQIILVYKTLGLVYHSKLQFFPHITANLSIFLLRAYTFSHTIFSFFTQKFSIYFSPKRTQKIEKKEDKKQTYFECFIHLFSSFFFQII